MGVHGDIGSSEAEKKFKMGAVGNAYLVLYNVVQFLGWSHMLYILLPHLDAALVKGVDRGQLYSDIELSVKVFQTAAVLEGVRRVGHSGCRAGVEALQGPPPPAHCLDHH